jgi:hypothetical protein
MPALGSAVVEQCLTCGRHQFPPQGMCPSCLGVDVEGVPLPDVGTIHSFTVNHQRWMPGMDVPCAFALVEFAEQRVRVLGRLRGCEFDTIVIGMPVQVHFEPGPGGVAVPVFAPTGPKP